MNELSAALRHFADQVEAGNVLADANQCAIVLMNEANEAQAVYMGMQAPAAQAGIFLLAAGIQRFNVGEIARPPVTPAVAAAVRAEAISIFEGVR